MSYLDSRQDETARVFASNAGPADGLRVRLAGGSIPVDHFEWNSLTDRIETHLTQRGGPSLTISSVNLDHLHHYRDKRPPGFESSDAGEWLYVADGWPIAWRASRASGRTWPRLAGSDILPEVMRLLDQKRGSLAVIGGTEDMHKRLRNTAAGSYPNVVIAGMWAPSREELTSGDQGRLMERALTDLNPDVVLVSLPKPLSEHWISRHAGNVGGCLYLPFGAAADFLSGHITRAPDFMQRVGMEWLFRLLLEPRRLARRYLLQAPRTISMLLAPTITEQPVRPSAGLNSR